MHDGEIGNAGSDFDTSKVHLSDEWKRVTANSASRVRLL